MERSAVWARLSEELGEGSESLSAVQGSSICGMGQPIWGMGLRVGLATCGVRLAILQGGSGRSGGYNGDKTVHLRCEIDHSAGSELSI